MNFESVRAAVYSRLAAYIAANHPATQVQYENRNSVDLNVQTAPFVTCDILFSDGQVASMGAAPLVRYLGAIYISVWCKGGEGTKNALTMLDEMAVLFKVTAFGGVNTQAPRPIPSRRQQDYNVSLIRVPFYFDQQ